MTSDELFKIAREATDNPMGPLLADRMKVVMLAEIAAQLALANERAQTGKRKA